jgi:hypothetical protein
MKKILSILKSDGFFGFCMFFIWCLPLLMIPFNSNRTYKVSNIEYKKKSESKKDEWHSVPHPVIVRHK